MATTKYKALRCKISRGGFSDERVFRIQFIGCDHSGVASRRHMWNAQGEPLGEGEPPMNEILEGLVAARVIEVLPSGTVMVSIPDGYVLELPVEQLESRPDAVVQNVPI